MRSIDSVRREARKRYKKVKKAGGHGWREVGDEMGISEGMAWRLANEDGYEPKDAHIRVQLGLPALQLAPACARCGEVHVSKRCVKYHVPRVRRSLWDWPEDELRRAMEEREEF